MAAASKQGRGASTGGLGFLCLCLKWGRAAFTPGGLPLWGGSWGREGGEGKETPGVPEATRKPDWVPCLHMMLRSMGCVLCAWLHVRGAEARQTLPWLP